MPRLTTARQKALVTGKEKLDEEITLDVKEEVLLPSTNSANEIEQESSKASDMPLDATILKAYIPEPAVELKHALNVYSAIKESQFALEEVVEVKGELSDETSTVPLSKRCYCDNLLLVMREDEANALQTFQSHWEKSMVCCNFLSFTGAIQIPCSRLSSKVSTATTMSGHPTPWRQRFKARTTPYNVDEIDHFRHPRRQSDRRHRY